MNTWLLAAKHGHSVWSALVNLRQPADLECGSVRRRIYDFCGSFKNGSDDIVAY